MKWLRLSVFALCSSSACEIGPPFELTTPEPTNLDAGHVGSLDAAVRDAAAHDAALNAAHADAGLPLLPREFAYDDEEP